MTKTQHLTLAAVIITIVIGPVAMLYLALSAHGHRPAAPAPPAVSAQPVVVVNA